ncbi:MAG: hypothetical protein M0024_02870 [Nitrospiraceae bacterium]|nr:hypothetical protein [Nitrospiraceae bacterium]
MSSIQLAYPSISSSPAWKWIILSTVLLGANMSSLDVSIVDAAMPTLKAEFGAKS